MHKILATILLLAFVGQTFSKAIMWAGYYTNTAAYAKNCENKAKPVLQCNGKCQLMKKLKQEEKKDEQNPERKSENKNETLICSKLYTSFNLPGQKCDRLHFATLQNGKEMKMPRYVFHPPAV